MNSLYVMSIGSYIFAAVNLNKDNTLWFILWNTLAIVLAISGGLIK